MKKFTDKNLRFFYGLIVTLALVLGVFFHAPTVSKCVENVSFAVNADDYIASLNTSSITTPSSYSLADEYPIAAENQTTSDFCWLYSSLKSLETSLLKQKGVYYNFSEVGMAYLSYLDKVELDSTQKFSFSGNFDNFVNIYQSKGLILESDVSNDLYSSISKDNYEDYRYIEDLASNNVNSQVQPIHLKNNNSFNNIVGVQNKANFVKKYIQTYGGLFAGLKGGTIFLNDGRYNYVQGSKSADISISFTEGHAICLVGWDDDIEIKLDNDPASQPSKGAFLALNSWGLKIHAKNGSVWEVLSLDYFYVPYEIAYTYGTMAGFVCVEPEETPVVEINDSSAYYFTNQVLRTNNTILNIFSYDEPLMAIEYKLNVSDLRNVSVQLFNGMTDYTSYCATTFDNGQKTIQIQFNFDKSKFYGGYYTVKFLNDDELIASESIYIYSGTELTGFTCRNDNWIDSPSSLDGAYLTNSNSATFYIQSAMDYQLHFSLFPINLYSYRLNNSVNAEPLHYSVVSTTVTKNGVKDSTRSTEFSRAIMVPVNSAGSFQERQNDYYISFYAKDSFKGCKLTIELQIDSVKYNNCSRTFYLHFFVSDLVVATRPDGIYGTDPIGPKTVTYILDGGENNPNNVTKIPNYVSEGSSMSNVKLYEPTKIGSRFIGWFSNPEGTGEKIESLGNSTFSDVKLYAVWEKENVEYFRLEFEMFRVWDYNSQLKEIWQTLDYGDSISFTFKFVELENLHSRYYVANYQFYMDGIKLNDGIVTSDIVDLYVNFPTLNAGTHQFSVSVNMVLANGITVSDSTAIEKTINKRCVGFEFDDLQYIYDGQQHYPTVNITDGSVYEEDLDDNFFAMSSYEKQSNSGSYSYSVKSLINSNYYFVAAESTCILVIQKRNVTVSWVDFNETYDGTNHLPEYIVNNVVDGDRVSFRLNSYSFVDVGTYSINIVPSSISNYNYYAVLDSDFSFTIKPASVVIVINDVEDRAQKNIDERAKPTYEIVGNVYGNDDLKVKLISEGFTSRTSGEYVIDCTIDNENYTFEVVKGKYKLTGYYYVFYLLPNGKTHIETVEEGKEPVGISKSDISAPTFSRVVYSDDYKVTGNDLYVEVVIDDYSSTVYTAGAAVIFVVVCIVFYFKRRNKGVA